jgi:quinol monooxygenase YgiN
MVEKVVRLTVSFSVTEAQMNDFKSIAAQMTDGARSEPGTLGYEWFVGGDGRKFRLVETYVDAAAIEAHFMGPVVQQLVPKLAAVSSVDGFEIYGDPGPKVAEMASAFGASIYQYWMGIGR